MKPASSYRKEVKTVDQLISIINQVGFPIVVTLYLLYRIESKLDLVVHSIQTLPDRMKEGM
jgi:hypothetical protein